MIVDDEILAIEDLRSLVSWEKHGFKIVAEANNGKKALELYKKYHPQIIFVDISMPVMDGLEFSSKIIHYNNNTKIILLTSYKDFEYAKQAVKIGVSNYLLKHEINEENLLEELQIIKNKLQEDERIQRFKRQEIIKKILEAREFSSEDQVYWQENIETLNGEFLIIVVKKDSPYPILNMNMIIEKGKDLNEQVRDFKNYTCSESVNYIDTIEINLYLYAFILSIDKINSRKEIRDLILKTVTEIQKKYRENMGNTISVVVNETVVNKENMSRIFKKLISNTEYSPFFGKEKIVWTEEIRIPKLQGDKLFDNELRNISQDVKKLNYDNVKITITDIFEKINIPYWDLNGFKKICRDLINLLENFRKDNDLIQICDLLENQKIDISLWYNVNSIKTWFIDEFKKAIEEVRQASNCIYSRKIQMVIQHIHRYYKEELVIEKVGKEFDISGVYLSQLFKKETGETFLKFLTNYRVKMAKEFLASNKYTVNEVAILVGYNTSQYFSKIFHEATGVTPKYCMKTGGTTLK